MVFPGRIQAENDRRGLAYLTAARVGEPWREIATLGGTFGVQNPPGLTVYGSPVESVTLPCLSILARVPNSRRKGPGFPLQLGTALHARSFAISFRPGILMNFSYAHLFSPARLRECDFRARTQPCQGGCISAVAPRDSREDTDPYPADRNPWSRISRKIVMFDFPNRVTTLTQPAVPMAEGEPELLAFRSVQAL